MNATILDALNVQPAIERATVDATRTRIGGRDVWTFTGLPVAVDEAVRKARDQMYSSKVIERRELADGRIVVTVKDWGAG